MGYEPKNERKDDGFMWASFGEGSPIAEYSGPLPENFRRNLDKLPDLLEPYIEAIATEHDVDKHRVVLDLLRVYELLQEGKELDESAYTISSDD